MKYYPKSQITTGLYTNGGEFVYASNKQNYKGYYWKTSKNEFYTGRDYKDTPYEELTRALEIFNSGFSVEEESNPSLIKVSVLNEEFDSVPGDENITPTFQDPTKQNDVYNQLINHTKRPKFIPSYSPNIPTEKDYQLGEYRRYFCKKANEFTYIEINKETFDKLVKRDKSYLWRLYMPFFISWVLVGDKKEVFNVNKKTVELKIQRNKTQLFNIYLQEDYLKYYKEKP